MASQTNGISAPDGQNTVPLWNDMSGLLSADGKTQLEDPRVEQLRKSGESLNSAI